jgi:hypothetical protein
VEKQWVYNFKYLFNKPFGEIPRVLYRHFRKKIKGTFRPLFSRMPSDWEFSRKLLPDWLTPLLPKNSHTNQIPTFFINSNEQKKRAREIREHFPKTILNTMHFADQTSKNTFDLLGSGPFCFQKKIDWHLDFKSGYRWNPKTLSAFLRYDELEKKYDIKIPWELSRFQHTQALGKAYWLSGDEKYAQTFVEQMLHWIQDNPLERGVNWVCPMDVAIRLVNWIWGYHFFENSPSFTSNAKNIFFKSVYVHARFVYNNPETGPPTSNHYLSNLVGLIYAGISFPGFKESQKWLKFALLNLEKEIQKQVYPDGVDYEASIPYHRLVLEMLLSSMLLCKMNGISWSRESLERIERMLEFTMHYTKPNGLAPQIGDNDSGRLHVLSEATRNDINDHRYLLAIGAVVFNRADFAQAAGNFHEEAYWLLGLEGLKKYQELLATSKAPLVLKSHSFPHGGIYIMRNRDCFLAVDAGKNGQGGNGGHAHNDVFSFVLDAFEEELLSDPGTGVYTGDYKLRNLLRSTSSHTILMVDNQEINPFEERLLFQLKDIALPKVLQWRTTLDYDLLEGEHSGYKRLADPVVHRRRIYFNKKLSFVELEDTLLCKKEHTVGMHFITPKKELKVFNPNRKALTIYGVKAKLVIYPIEPFPTSLPNIEEIPYSPSYGKLETGIAIRFKYRICGTSSICFLLIPVHSDDDLHLRIEQALSMRKSSQNKQEAFV